MSQPQNTLKLKALLPTEDDEAHSLLQWAAVKRVGKRRLAELMVMIPNGALGGVGDGRERAIRTAVLKRLGFRKGVADYLLMVGRGGYHGLFLELKRRELSFTYPEQYEFQALAVEMGYCAKICLGWEAAKLEIERYLEAP